MARTSSKPPRPNGIVGTGATPVLAKPSVVAKRLGVSRVAVYKAIQAGRYAAVRIFAGSGPLRVFTDESGLPLRKAPAPSARTELVSPVELASRLDVSADVVRAACKAGLIGRAVRSGPRPPWRIHVDSKTWLPRPERER